MILETGTLVRGRGSFGIVLGVCKKRWAKDDDVWVMWHGDPVLKIASCRFLEVLNESR